MHSHWLIPGTLSALSALVITLPAEAAQLQSWWFDAQNNRLTFTTDVGVQPRAQMIFSPTRVVVDLPGTTLGRATQSQRVGGAVREVRAGQFDAQTTRIVIELSESYAVSPQQVEVRGLSANQWVVQLPAPGTAAATPASGAPQTAPPSQAAPGQAANQRAANQIVRQGNARGAAQLEGISTTGDGFLLRVSGNVPQPRVTQSGRGPDNRQLTIELPNTAIASTLRPIALPSNRYSVITWEITQLESDPPTTRITLALAAASPDWRVLNNQGGVILLPPRGVAISSIPDSPPPTATSPVAAQPPPSRPTQPIAVPPTPTTPPPTPRPAAPPPSVRNERRVVVIDPGHGGVDPGAVGIGGLQEKHVIFPISLRVREILESQGVTVIMTRYDDRTVELQPRVDVAERANATVFVSIHANAISLSRPEVNGTESYYASESGRRLAATIHASMLAATGMNDRGVRQANFFVIRRTSMPATLLELGFVTGAQDAPRLRDPAWQETMANAIARGILQYLQQNP
ncbi:N-acetylmuramoyl-L-alanine amidase [Pseudanabaena sp. FACHB-2040]|uniref:N-acetylmuramoyl-L-alanine amidase n=1 Tax=Pseudanabaena sp. FACHB-2040 TaxID=2692859 RepID=UPI001685FABF|nr:N-acetylmuramoyl-L-alanine amidase [Pseudanabaena sp. FACHB-2040]MBD2259603.1 N-acetylmuramoyl-L-alanine amidase [Pseudanabaena sp. FACHB-2040]